MFTLVIFILVFGVLIIVHEFGHFIMAVREGVRVERFSIGFGPRLFKKKIKHTEFNISVIPLGGYVKLSGDSLEECKGRRDEYFSKTPLARARIIFCGPLLNYVMGFFFFWLVFFGGYPTLTTKVGALIKGFGAEASGIQAGDKIIAVDGQSVNSWEELQMVIFNKKPQNAVELLVMRQDRALVISVQLKQKQLEDEVGSKRSVGLLGISPDMQETVKVKYGFLESFDLSIRRTFDLTRLTYIGLWRMITGTISFRDSVTGPIGIFYITDKAAQMGVASVLNLMGLLSVSLAIFNLLPLPVLDGGHILLLLIEKLRGRNISLKAEKILTRLGFAFIMTLVIVVTYNDIVRFFGESISRFFR